MNILDFIPKEKTNAISREALCDLTGYDDRKNRLIISQLRAEGNLICNRGKGYYIAADLDDIERQYRADKARAMSILKRLKVMRAILRDAGRRV